MIGLFLFYMVTAKHEMDGCRACYAKQYELMPELTKRIAVLGAGNMGAALIGGILKAGVTNREHLVATTKSLEHAEEAFSQVMRMEPNFEKANEIYFRLGIIYKQQQKYHQSLDVGSARLCYRNTQEQY